MIEDKLVFKPIGRIILKMPLRMVQYDGEPLFVKNVTLKNVQLPRKWP